MYYSHDGITIYHGDCREIMPQVMEQAACIVTDPPYGIAYESGYEGSLPRSIAGDTDTSLRDWMVEIWEGPALMFGTWKRPIPDKVRQVLIWDTKGALGMGALDLPWKPSHQQIYVIGTGFHGHRGTDVLQYAPVQSMASQGRTHPHEKPVALLKEVISKCPDGLILDPFMGTGSTLSAAKGLRRNAIGIEIEERYCEVAATRLQQEVLF